MSFPSVVCSCRLYLSFLFVVCICRFYLSFVFVVVAGRFCVSFVFVVVFIGRFLEEKKVRTAFALNLTTPPDGVGKYKHTKSKIYYTT